MCIVRWRIARCLFCAFAVGLSGMSGGVRVAQAAEPTMYRLMIPSQPLGTALQEFARQSGIQVIFFSHLTDGVRAPALDGQYTVKSALNALLANSPLTFRMINSRTVEITAVAPAKTSQARAAIAVRLSERLPTPESFT